MDDLESKIGSILSNPEMMQKISAIAKNLGNADDGHAHPAQSTDQVLPNIDISMLQKLSGLAGQSEIDKNQQSLLCALSPYLSKNRIQRLEKAMRAAKMAKIATAVFASSGTQFQSGR